MSSEIINVINCICDKIGIAIDWTAENVWPQVMDILGRYRVMQLIVNAIWIIASIGIVAIFVALWIKAIAAHGRALKECKSNIWWDYSTYSKSVSVNGALPLIICSAFIGSLVLLLFVASADEFLKWLLVPEIKYLEMLKTYIQ